MKTLALAALVAVGFAASPALAQVAAAPTTTVGDAWTYRQINSYNRLPLGEITREWVDAAGGPQLVSRSATDASAGESRYASPGVLASGPLSDRARGTLTPALELMPFPLEPGKTWKQTVMRQDPVSGQNRRVLVEGKVVGWETVKVPAGEFRALKVERRMWLGDYGDYRGETWRAETEWYAPEVKGSVKMVVFEEYPPCNCGSFVFWPGDRFVYELTSFKRG